MAGSSILSVSILLLCMEVLSCMAGHGWLEGESSRETSGQWPRLVPIAASATLSPGLFGSPSIHI